VWPGRTASEERPDERYIGWRVKDVPVAVDLSDTEEPHFSVVNPADGAISGYELRELTQEYQWTEETDLNLNLDLLLPLERMGMPGKLKLGGRHKTKDKERDNDFYEYEFLEEPSMDQVGNCGLHRSGLPGGRVRGRPA
jgi:hypothetical protein